MRFISISLYFIFFFLHYPLYGSHPLSINSWVEKAFEDIEKDLKQATIATSKGVCKPPQLKSGKVVGADPDLLKKDFVKEMASFKREHLKSITGTLDAHEKKIVHMLFGENFDVNLFSPSLIKSVNFNQSDGELSQAKKFCNVGMNILFSALITSKSLEHHAVTLFNQTPLIKRNTWNVLDDSNNSILTSGIIHYNVFLQEKNPVIRFYFYNQDWETPHGDRLKNENLVAAQIKLSVKYKKKSSSPKLAYTTVFKGNYIRNISEKEKNELASQAFKAAGTLYAIMAAKSTPGLAGTDSLIMSILGSNRVDMAASASRMFKYVAALQKDSQQALKYLNVSKKLLDDAYRYLPFTQAYMEFVQKAFMRIQHFLTDCSITEDQFIQDFKLVVGYFPLFAIERDKKAREDEEIKESSSIIAWEELMRARKEGRSANSIEGYTEKLISAFNYNPAHFPLSLNKHQNYYNYNALLKMLNREKKINFSLTFEKAFAVAREKFLIESSPVVLTESFTEHLNKELPQEKANQEFIEGFEKALDNLGFIKINLPYLKKSPFLSQKY